MSNDYEVGYGRPPKQGQFKPGQSGNPSEKRKPRLSEAEIIAKIRDQPVWVKVNGRNKKVTAFEAALMQAINMSSIVRPSARSVARERDRMHLRNGSLRVGIVGLAVLARSIDWHRQRNLSAPKAVKS
jgi:hypothetical protein